MLGLGSFLSRLLATNAAPAAAAVVRMPAAADKGVNPSVPDGEPEFWFPCVGVNIPPTSKLLCLPSGTSTHAMQVLSTLQSLHSAFTTTFASPLAVQI